MQAPIHFDLDEVRARITADVTRVCDEALAQTKDADGRVLVEMQRELALSMIDARVKLIGWYNDHRAPEAQALALGSQMGSILGSFMLNSTDAVSELLMDRMTMAINDCLGVETKSGAVRTRGSIVATRGGHA